ncbi:glycoside hydrolase family 5 protein [Dactylosporangium sp. NPDC051541]|uniref:glycoside hydrolase family 5 protein n=1 Tax=Dactylosporangium sp. NPDC051541 TaxID=3363977 RepID=UPI0037A25121
MSRTRLYWIAALVVVVVAGIALVPVFGKDKDKTVHPESAKAGQRLQMPLHAEGSKIVDARGETVTFTGVNWFGLETNTFAPHGLWSRKLDDMLDQMVGQGFNSMRLPFSNELFDAASKPNGVDYALNPQLKGLTGAQIMDRVVEGATKRGMMVILDRHRPTSQGQSNLWYTDKVSEDRWIADWVDLAKHYKDNPLVVGADLHNEPHGEATWGDGNAKTDWQAAAQRAGDAVLKANPNWLIIVEGIESYKGDGYWWGGNLQGAKDHPVRLSDQSKLVYSAHDYSPKVWSQQWFTDPAFPANMPALWDKQFGYLVKNGTAPVLMGEFGGRSVAEKDAQGNKDLEGIWQRNLVAYLKDNGLSYTYWAWNPNSGDTGGVLKDDWTTVDADKAALLKTYQAPLAASGQ